MKGLKTHQIDFEILPTLNSKKLIFLDASSYYKQPETPILRITPPGHTKYFIVNLEPNKTTIFNSDTIGYSPLVGSDCFMDLPDGIWEFTYAICPYDYFAITKSYLRTTQHENNIAKIYSLIDVSDYDCKKASCIKKDLIDLQILTESAKANVEQGNINKGHKHFMLAQNKVRNILEKINNQ